MKFYRKYHFDETIFLLSMREMPISLRTTWCLGFQKNRMEFLRIILLLCKRKWVDVYEGQSTNIQQINLKHT